MFLQFLEIDFAVELEFRVENSREVARWCLQNKQQEQEWRKKIVDIITRNKIVSRNSSARFVNFLSPKYLIRAVLIRLLQAHFSSLSSKI